MFVPETTSRPPAGMVMPQTEQLIFTVLTQLPFIYNLFIAFKNLVKGDPTCLLFAIGGVIASSFEPFVDVLGFCFFPREGNWIAFEWVNRPIPMFVPATYGWYVGGIGYWFWTMYQDDKTFQKDIWGMWLKSWISNLILEYPALYMGVYTYYGYQPFTVGGFPLWFPAINAIAPMVGATIVNLMAPHLKGWRKLTIIPIVSSSFSIAHGIAGWPMWIALSTDIGYQVTYPAAIGTLTLLVTGVWVMSKQFPESGALKLESKPRF
ncbi:hypothetical protein K432DRAFT_24153 [Lepidopterella palustris CBS 459.81]|uniref:Uncharacterized protein n=1 Tax=Lepidopterella palustris CBS 459.81 TaxID=1314670 RepID=A0A8E2JG70_9PEZI|nr:hypothetical protein K432DRAFT_24153 [Lepidopterella palustris CBS 459.81]